MKKGASSSRPFAYVRRFQPLVVVIRPAAAVAIGVADPVAVVVVVAVPPVAAVRVVMAAIRIAVIGRDRAAEIAVVIATHDAAGIAIAARGGVARGRGPGGRDHGAEAQKAGKNGGFQNVFHNASPFLFVIRLAHLPR